MTLSHMNKQASTHTLRENEREKEDVPRVLTLLLASEKAIQEGAIGP